MENGTEVQTLACGTASSCAAYMMHTITGMARYEMMFADDRVVFVRIEPTGDCWISGAVGFSFYGQTC